MTSTEELTTPRPVERMVLLDDLHVREDGGGRIVEAYAAVFNRQTEIHDQDGHYREENDPGSFTRTIQHKAPKGFGVLFNHARTVDGGPNPLATMPIGVPVEVRADDTGVFTATQYLENPLADDVLNAIKAGALRAQSYSGRFLRSMKAPGRARGDLPTIRRMEIDMREYGPAVFASYGDAAILGMRAGSMFTESDLFLRTLLALPGEKRLEWLQQFEMGTTLPSGVTDLSQHGTSFEEPAEVTAEPISEPDHSESHSRDGNHSLRTYIMAQRQMRGIPKG
jgi:HK97 family phage prohead protease